MVGNGTGVRHDDELAGRDLAAGAVGRVVDGVAARAARRLERHAADVAGRILVARRDGAGQGAGGIDRAGRRQREGEGAGRGARRLPDRVGELAAVEHDVACILFEHQPYILRRGNGDGDLLRAGVLVSVNGGLCRDRRGAAGLGGQRHGGAGAAVQRDHVAAFRYRPADGIGLAGHIGVGLSGRVVLLRDRIQRDRIARLDAGRARRDLHIVIAADGDDGRAGLDRIRTARDHALKAIRTSRGHEVRQIQGRSVSRSRVLNSLGIDDLVVIIIPSKGLQCFARADDACLDRQGADRSIQLISSILRFFDQHNARYRSRAGLDYVTTAVLREISDLVDVVKRIKRTLQPNRAGRVGHKLYRRFLDLQRGPAVVNIFQFDRRILLAELCDRLLGVADRARDIRLGEDIVIFARLPDCERHLRSLVVALRGDLDRAGTRRLERYFACRRFRAAVSKGRNTRVIDRPDDTRGIDRLVAALRRCDRRGQHRRSDDSSVVAERYTILIRRVLVTEDIRTVRDFVRSCGILIADLQARDRRVRNGDHRICMRGPRSFIALHINADLDICTSAVGSNVRRCRVIICNRLDLH